MLGSVQLKRDASQRSRAGVSVLILTYNEEVNLVDCLDSVYGWVTEIVVVDSGSQDKTLAIAERFGARIYSHAFEDFGTSRNWAFDNLEWNSDWVLVLDADERVSPELRQEIVQILDGHPEHKAYYINRRYIYYGKWIRHSGWYPSWNVRLFRFDSARYEKRANHNHVIVQGITGYCRHDLIHEDRHDFAFFLPKQMRFSADEAREYYRIRRGLKSGELRGRFFGSSVERKRWIREHVWAHLPFRPCLKFIYLYVFRLGFLDGRHGLRFCLTWAAFEFMNSLYLWELENYKSDSEPGAIAAPRYYKSQVVSSALTSEEMSSTSAR